MPSKVKKIKFGAFIGREILKQRKEIGLSQLDLAIACKMTAPAISQIENGKRINNLQSLSNICEAMGVKLSVIVNRAETEYYSQ